GHGRGARACSGSRTDKLSGATLDKLSVPLRGARGTAAAARRSDVGYEPPIRWDIVEEHLDEAAFLYQLWEQSLRSPKYTLREIAEGPEERMLAHLDGLVVGGSPVAKKLLIPSLESDEPGVVFAAAYALLASEDGDFLAPV